MVRGCVSTHPVDEHMIRLCQMRLKWSRAYFYPQLFFPRAQDVWFKLIFLKKLNLHKINAETQRFAKSQREEGKIPLFLRLCESLRLCVEEIKRGII